MNNEPLRYEDAAEPVSVVDASGKVIATGWKPKRSRHVLIDTLPGDSEHYARYQDCTDMPCECGKRRSKSYICCDDCRRAIKDKEWAELYSKKAVEWDGKTPLCVYDGDRFLFSDGEVAEYVHEWIENGNKLEDVRLQLCEPNHGYTFDMQEFLSDCLPEDGEIDDREINKVVNEWITSHSPFSWESTSTPVKIESLPTFKVAEGGTT